MATITSAAAEGRVFLKTSDSMGRVAIARRSFDAGDVVLEEGPFLVIPHRGLSSESHAPDEHLSERVRSACVRHETLAQLAIAHGLPPSFFDAVEAALTELSEAELKLLASDLYSPLGHQPANEGQWMSDLLRPTKDEMEACKDVLSETTTPVASHLDVLKQVFWPPRAAAAHHNKAPPLERAAFSLLQFIHGVRVNTHADGKAGFSAVFLTASKFSHSCNPNTFWFLRSGAKNTASISEIKNSRAVHVATRRIAEGEMLTFSYVGSGWNMLADTMERRLAIRPLNFVCACPRCAAFDAGEEHTRLLHCPVCLMANADKPLSASANLQLLPTGWRCRCCGAEPGSSDVSETVGSERAMVDHVLSIFFRSFSGDAKRKAHPAPPTIAAKASVVRRVLVSYGPGHYLTTAAVCGFARHLCEFLAARSRQEEDPSLAEPTLSLRFVMQCLVGASVWFEKNMKDSPQHVRLLSHICELHVLLTSLGAVKRAAIFTDEGDGDGLKGFVKFAAKFGPLVERFCSYKEYAAVSAE